MQGQFAIVVAEELPAMRAAFRRFPNYNPKLTIVICGKRHHTRFYPTEAATAAHDGNPKAGTVVDRGVTAVYEFDFFLQGMIPFCDIVRGLILSSQPMAGSRARLGQLTTMSYTTKSDLLPMSCSS
jgi:hypothetical protein